MLLFVLSPVYGQKWQKAVDKTEKSYLVGRYDKAEKANEKYRKKVQKKLGKTHYYLSDYFVFKNKISLAVGTFKNFDKEVDGAMKLSETVKESDLGYYLKISRQIIDNYIEYGNFIVAEELLKQLEDDVAKAEFSDPYYDTYFKYQHGQILAGKGFYTDAYNIFKEIEPSMKSLMKSQQEQFDPKSGQFKKVSLSKNELANREFSYANLLAMTCSSYGLKGRFASADSVFEFSEKWIRKNLGRTSAGYFNLLIEKSKVDFIRRDFKACRKQLNEAISNGQNSLSPTHKLVLKGQIQLIETFIESDRGGRSESEINSFGSKVNDRYPSSSVYRLWVEFLLSKHLYETKDQSALELNIYNIIQNNANIPKYHPLRNDLLNFNIHLSLVNRNFAHTKAYFTRILDNKKNLYGTESPKYHHSVIDQADYNITYTNNIQDALIAYDTSYTDIIKPQLENSHPINIKFLGIGSKIHIEKDQYALAEEDLQKALNISAGIYGIESLDHGVLLNRMARLQIKKNNFQLARQNLDSAIEITRKEREGDDIGNYSNALETEAMLDYVQGFYDDAISAVKRSQKMSDRAVASAETSREGLEVMAKTYVSLSKLASAELLLKATIKEYGRLLGKDNKLIVTPLLDYSDIYITYGEYGMADDFAEHAMRIAREVYGEQSSYFAKCLVQKAKLSSVLSDFEKAEEYVKTILEIQKSIYGEEHLEIANSLTQLGLIKYYQNQPIDEIDLGIIYLAKGDYNRARTLLQQSRTIWEYRAGKRNNLRVADINVLLGDVHYMLRDYQVAEDLYRESQRQYKKFFHDNHPQYVKVTSKLSKTYYMMGNTKRSKEYIDEALGNYNLYIKEYFPGLSERQKTKFWNSINSDYEFYNTLTLKMKDSNPDMIGEMYNNALTTKALLLNTSLKIRDRILKSTDENLHQLYFSWKEKKEQLTGVLAMSIEEQQEENINPDRLKEEIEELERQLSDRAEGFSQSIDQRKVTWENVKNALKPSEVAVEMVRFRYYNQVFSDSIIYAALYITNNSENDKPRMFIFPNGKDLESKWIAYNRNSIVYKINDQYSYKQFWQPFEKELGSVATIYLSSDGIFNQINLESIPLGNGKYVIDNSNIILVNNTKDLYFKQVKTILVQEKKIASLVGSPKFYATSEDVYPAGGMRGSRVNDLPGTRIEISELDKILLNNGWTTDKLLGTEATENNVKLIDNPRVFHIATHGFFTSQKSLKTHLDGVELSEYEAYENPLLRNGLLLSGAGDLLGSTSYNYNMGSGILTAYEAMNLNLDNTELVVLSACETGLGDVQTGEGVYGLQRSFLVAGAQTLIMSLFKVSDEATQKLMVKFYNNWIETGNKREAFSDAKKEIRTEYRDPIYWGAFVMIGLE